MEGIIVWLVILGISLLAQKKKKAKKVPTYQPNKPNTQPRTGYAQNRPMQQVPQNRPMQQMPQNRPMQQATQNRPMQQVPQNRPMQRAPQNDIMSRAVANAQENDVDELQRSQSAPVVNESSVEIHNMVGVVDITKTSELMNQINDLIVMGYQSELRFERDFVAEGIDMLNSYELPEVSA